MIGGVGKEDHMPVAMPVSGVDPSTLALPQNPKYELSYPTSDVIKKNKQDRDDMQRLGSDFCRGWCLVGA